MRDKVKTFPEGPLMFLLEFKDTFFVHSGKAEIQAPAPAPDPDPEFAGAIYWVTF